MAEDSELERILKNKQFSKVAKALADGCNPNAVYSHPPYDENRPLVLMFQEYPSKKSEGTWMKALDSLLKAKADPDGRGFWLGMPDCLPLHIAMAWGHLPAVKALLDAGATPTLESHWRRGKAKSNAFTIAVLDSQKEILEVMLSYPHVRESINTQGDDGTGYGALHYAAINDTLSGELTQILLDAGADPKLKDSFGRTPESQARGKSKSIIADFIEKKRSLEECSKLMANVGDGNRRKNVSP